MAKPKAKRGRPGAQAAATDATAGSKAKTEGQRRLLELSGSETELAKAVGCGSAVVGHWRRGRRVPGEAHRHKLELLYGIPRRAWDVAPGAEVPPAKGGARRAAGEAADDEGTLAITKSEIDAVRKALEDEDLTDAAAAKLRDTLAKLLALRARMERDAEMLEDRIIREHPEWQRVQAAILRALKPYPDAARAVAEALGAS